MTPRTIATFALLIAAVIVAATVVHLRRGDPMRATPGVDSPAAAQGALALKVPPSQPAEPADGASTMALPPRRASSSTFLPELRGAADSGDAVAACSLAVALARCSELKRIALGAAMGEGAPAAPEAAAPECRGASVADLDDRYRYQAQAFASGDPAAERWFVTQPMLGDDDFRMNTPNAIDFRRRAPAYVAHALQRRQREDLTVLLQVYMPPGYFESSSPLRMRDDAMFLALADIAERGGVAPDYIRSTAAHVRAAAGSDVLARSRERAAQLGGAWPPSTVRAPSTGTPEAFPACDALSR
ncbi:hypothetical protein [Lysobacter xanthus]